MTNSLKSVIILTIFIVLFPLVNGWGKKQVCLFRAGDIFPSYVFSSRLTPEDLNYLGLTRSLKHYLGFEETSTFTLMDIQAELIIVEFLNVYCTSCQNQAPVMNKVYKLIQQEESLREKVKLISICSGNNLNETNTFKKKNSIPFPMIPDPKFDAYEAIGDPCGTPFILLVRKNMDKGIITWSHIGLVSSPLYFVQETWDALKTDLKNIAAKADEKRSRVLDVQKPKPFLTDEELKKRIHERMESQFFKLNSLERVALKKNKDIFIGQIKAEGVDKTLFFKLISRNPVCDVCHAVHFIIAFDDTGTVIDFIPLHITKYGNIPWNKKEIEKTLRILLGKSVLKPIEFNPQVDAISKATMSSALIFNAVEKIEKDYFELQTAGYIKE